MDIENLKNMLDGKPADLIKFAAEHGIDFLLLIKSLRQLIVYFGLLISLSVKLKM
jgi:hypothetical protein